jgi:hypothetical protein
MVTSGKIWQTMVNYGNTWKIYGKRMVTYGQNALQIEKNMGHHL